MNVCFHRCLLLQCNVLPVHVCMSLSIALCVCASVHSLLKISICFTFFDNFYYNLTYNSSLIHAYERWWFRGVHQNKRETLQTKERKKERNENENEIKRKRKKNKSNVAVFTIYAQCAHTHTMCAIVVRLLLVELYSSLLHSYTLNIVYKNAIETDVWRARTKQAKATELNWTGKSLAFHEQ